VIGEATKGLSESIKLKNSQVPWRQIAGMRDFLIHVYFGVKLETVWNTTKDLVELKEAVKSELKMLP
jgi:uncharacterized protein with HEPN domain